MTTQKTILRRWVSVSVTIVYSLALNFLLYGSTTICSTPLGKLIATTRRHSGFSDAISRLIPVLNRPM